jgi:hypothetical protein
MHGAVRVLSFVLSPISTFIFRDFERFKIGLILDND